MNYNARKMRYGNNEIIRPKLQECKTIFDKNLGFLEDKCLLKYSKRFSELMNLKNVSIEPYRNVSF